MASQLSPKILIFPCPAPTWHRSHPNLRAGARGRTAPGQIPAFPGKSRPKPWHSQRCSPYLGPAPSTLDTSTVAVECLPPVSSSELTSHCPLLDLVLSRFTPFLAFTLQRETVGDGSSPSGTPGSPWIPCHGTGGDFPLIPSGCGEHHQGWQQQPIPAPLSWHFVPPITAPAGFWIPRAVTPLWHWASLGWRTGEPGAPHPPFQGLPAGPEATGTLESAL